jgi:hypothetical protein
MQGRHAAARAAARPSAPQAEAMACFKIKLVLGVSYSAWCSERRIKSTMVGGRAAGSKQVFARVSLQ